MTEEKDKAAQPVEKAAPSTPSDARALAQMLMAGADDPMWANHAEVNKATLRRAAEALRFMAGQVETMAALSAQQAAQPVAGEPVTLADVLDALNLFNRPKPSEDDGPWEGGHYIRVDHLPAFINIIAKAWFAPAAPAPVALVPLTLDQIDSMEWGADCIGMTWGMRVAAVRAVERAHGIKAGKEQQ